MTPPADAIAWRQVRRLTFVPFLADGRCALVPAGNGLALPSGPSNDSTTGRPSPSR